MARGRRGWRLIAAALLWLASAMAAGGHAAPLETGSQAPFLLKADEVTFDENLGLVVARGHVEISQEGRVLLADTVTYNQKTDVMTAAGHVSLMEPTGEVTFAEYAEFTDDLKNGVVDSIRMLLADNSRLAANGGRRIGGVTTEMSKAVYSPCDLCKSDPTRAPLWQIKAVRVTHDSVTKDVEYRDASMEFFGIPVAYLPYFSHPDPTVRRRSGFLAPSYGNSSDLGTFIRTPYYWAIDQNKDATISPMYTTDQGLVMAGEYRHRLVNGEFQFSGSYTHPTDPPPGAENRGHIRGHGRFDLNDTWRSGFDVVRSTDDTYLRRYRFPANENLFGSADKSLTSTAYVEGFKRRSYARATAFSYQGLRATDDPGLTPLILPLAEYNFRGEPDRYGGRFNIDTSVLSLTRDEGTDSRRISVKSSWNLPHIGSAGDIYNLTASLQTDLYDVDGVPTPGNPSVLQEGYTGRVFPQLQFNWRYPFVRQQGTTTQFLEPIAGFVVAPRGGNPDKIPNEDSVDVEFDDLNLFRDTRFTGVDRVEGGQRVIYGLRGGVYGAGGGSSTAFIGQSYRFNQDSPYAPGTGLNDQLSDIVGRLSISPNNLLDFLYRFRFNAEDLRSRRNEVTVGVGPSRLRLNLTYLFFDEEQQTSQFGDREEISGTVNVGLTDHWSAFAGARRNLAEENAGFISLGGGLQYSDECLIFMTSVSRRFTQDRDLVPSTTILFQLVFKNLGEVRSSSGASAATEP
jgi:LPS-assembly protein